MVSNLSATLGSTRTVRRGGRHKPTLSGRLTAMVEAYVSLAGCFDGNNDAGSKPDIPEVQSDGDGSPDAPLDRRFPWMPSFALFGSFWVSQVRRDDRRGFGR